MEEIVKEYISKPNLGLQFDEETHGETFVVRCRGAFSLGSYSRLDEIGKKVKAAKAKRVVLDLHGVQHMDSTGMGTLATIFKETRAAGRDLVLVPSPEVRTILVTVNLDKVFPLAETVEAALGA